jgi:hypothetical protein
VRIKVEKMQCKIFESVSLVPLGENMFENNGRKKRVRDVFYGDFPKVYGEPFRSIRSLKRSFIDPTRV